MSKEQHPYLHHFDCSRPWKYLIIGTFPPNKEVREGKKSLTDYFYGNKGSLWKILSRIYTEYDFENGTRIDLIDRMKKWQERYNVGITDTLKTVSRKNIASADDNDLVLGLDDYNHDLKAYVLENLANIEGIIFTSSGEALSALATFRTIMGSEFSNIPISKLIIGLPSPSGSSNTAWFNVNNDSTLGLHNDLFRYITLHRPEYIAHFASRWKLKKQKQYLKKEERHTIEIPNAPKGLVKEFKISRYKEVLPLQK